MEPEGSLSFSQELVNGTFPEGQMNPVHNFPPCLPKIHYNNIVMSTPRSSELYLPFRYANQNFVSI